MTGPCWHEHGGSGRSVRHSIAFLYIRVSGFMFSFLSVWILLDWTSVLLAFFMGSSFLLGMLMKTTFFVPGFLEGVGWFITAVSLDSGAAVVIFVLFQLIYRAYLHCIHPCVAFVLSMGGYYYQPIIRRVSQISGERGGTERREKRRATWTGEVDDE